MSGQLRNNLSFLQTSDGASGRSSASRIRRHLCGRGPTLLDALNGRGRTPSGWSPTSGLRRSRSGRCAAALRRHGGGRGRSPGGDRRIAVGAGVLKHIAASVRPNRAARGAGIARSSTSSCENLHGAAAIFREMVLAYRPRAARHAAHIGFVDTVIARMVPPLTPEPRALQPHPGRAVYEPPGTGGSRPAAAHRPHDALQPVRLLHRPQALHPNAVMRYWPISAICGYSTATKLADDEIYFQARGAMEELAPR